jgi:hypothetical protein
MLKKLRLQKYYSVGAKIICKTNNLIDKEIYNNKVFAVDKYDKDSKIYVLKDQTGKIFEIPKNIMIRKGYFDSAYAINIHQAQGMTLNSYYWAKEDNDWLSGRVAYTVISRLRQEKN